MRPERGRPNCADRDRARERSETAGGEDQPQVTRSVGEALLDDEREQHLGRTHEQQVGDRRGDQGRPQPGVAPDVAQAGPDLARGAGSLRGRGQDRHRRHRQQRHDRDRERRRVQSERPAGPDRSDHQATERGTRKPQRHRADQLVERVGLRQHVRGQKLRHERIGGGVEECGGGAVHNGDRQQFPERERTRHRQRREQRQRHRANGVGGEHHETAIEAVADRASDQQARNRRDRHRDPDGRERRRRVRHRVHLPRQRDEEQAVAE